MSMRPTRLALAALLAASLTAGCNKEKAPATTQAPAAQAQAGNALEPAPDAVVATFGNGQKVTFGELNERIKEPLANLDKQKYQLRKRGLEGLVTERLVKDEATKRNLTEEQLLKAEIDDKIPAPPEEKIKEVFEGAKGQLPPGATYEQMKPQIVDFLSGQQKQEAAQKFFESLRQGANVKYELPEPARAPAERKQVAATGPSKGPEGAPVTIVEFSDFECPFCSRANAAVDQVTKTYGDKVRVVFRQFPLEFHKQAQKAAEASLCANDQGKFWEMHDQLFANQKALGVEDLKKHATELKLDTAKFNACLDSGEKAAQVKADLADGSKVGVNGTPAFFINGIMLSGAQPFDEFKSIIDAELSGAKK
ncbi:thioredoxin domain-containing protein [Corallococcus sp. ZKHCc1 1396]|uniref:Thioredoxin domain-containing protein n=1 Tax=Corallococcus soli TaxID=2710757 RepID=A0ABR9PLF1_9BACT|nr:MULTISPECIES: thioredoxin domain-containing protein [Corallococcus]MBE4748716.1 thioredoxin domain-containing protein [Corallococcus soli]MCY1031351.1 thioredoxin domain-containing protein [Corallococcus sp. BB11-1]